MYRNLSEFLKILDKAGELGHIRQPVSPYLEIGRITDAESKSPGGGKGLFFENVRGYDFPVVTNMFGSHRRMCMALGVNHLDEIGERIRKYIELNPPKNFREALNILPMMPDIAKAVPRKFRGKTPPCQEVVLTGNAVDLSKLPVLHCWAKDAGAFITLPMVFTKSLVSGRRNCGMYRMQIFDSNTTGMHWHIHKDGSHFHSEYRKAGKRMPVAVAIGCDPATIYSATAPLPRGIDEMMLSGFIRRQPVVMAKCITIDMEVPAEAEFVLEGYVDPGELRREGPFGDHTGYYSLADDYPVFHVTAVTHRKNPVYSATIVGRPPMEDCYMALATERIFLPMLQAILPEIKDYCFPWEGVFHNIVIVAIDKEYPGHAQKIMSALWGQGQMSFCKAIVVVNKDVNPQNFDEVLKTLVNRLDLTSDITLTQGVLDVLDHSSPFPNFGNKIGIDLTQRFAGEPPRNNPPLNPLSKGQSHVFNPLPRGESDVFNPLPKGESDVANPLSGQSDVVNPLLRGGRGCVLIGEELIGRFIPETVNCRHLLKELSDQTTPNRILAISADKTQSGKAFADTLFEISELQMFNIFILFDKEINLSDDSLMLWKIFNNTDPGRHMFFKGNRMVMDACRKGIADGYEREWPEEI